MTVLMPIPAIIRCSGSAKPARQTSTQRELYVNRVLESLASLEAWDLGSSDFDRFASLRITTSTGRTILDSESTKTNQNNLLTVLQSVSNSVDHSVQRTTSLRLWDVCRCRDGINQLGLVHSNSPSL